MAYPVKSKAKQRRIEKKTVFVIRDGSRVILNKRPEKGLLAGLYEFPNVEGHLSEEEALEYVKRNGTASDADTGVRGGKTYFFTY